MDIELIKMVADDLDFLFNDWNQDIDDASLRRSSPVLRSLLVEGLIGKVAHQIGQEIRIKVPSICRLMTEQELAQMNYYQAGGATYKGMKIQSAFLIRRALSAEERKAWTEMQMSVLGKSYSVKLGVFLKQPSFGIDGVPINREEVVKYVANKLGGAHYDPIRSTNQSDKNATLHAKYLLLDRVRDGIVAADKNAIYYELLSIGQSVVNSRDVRNLRKRLKHIQECPSVINLPWLG